MFLTARTWPLAALVLVCLSACKVDAEESLFDAWRLARERNHSLRASQLRAEAAHFNAQAVASQRLPSFETQTGVITRSSEPSFIGGQPALGFPTSSIPFAQRNATQFSARLSAPLWTAGRLGHESQAAWLQHSASQRAAASVDRQIWLAVAEAYFRVLSSRCQLDSSQRRVVSAQAIERELIEGQRANRVEHREVLAAHVAVLKASQAHLQDRNALVDAQADYNQLLGRPPGAVCSLLEPNLPLLPGSLPELTEIAVQHRPELEQLSKEIESYRQQAAAWRSSERPQLNAQAGYAFEENSFQSPEGIGSFGLVLDWKLFDGGGRKRRAQEADRTAAALLAEHKELQTLVETEVWHAWNRRQEAMATEQVAVAALAHAAEHSRAIRERVRSGLLLASEQSAADTGLTQAEADRRIASMQRMIADLRLRYTCGLLEIQ